MQRDTPWVAIALALCAACGGDLRSDAQPAPRDADAPGARDAAREERLDAGEDVPDGSADAPGDAPDEADAPDMSDADADPAPWPIEDGLFGAPRTTFTIPAPRQGEGIYAGDVQAKFKDVDWATLDRLYLPAGRYPAILLGNLPDRDASRPLVISNIGGQVRVGGQGSGYGISLRGGSGWVLTGRYDPVSKTGDESFTGHRGGAFARSQGRYGIVIDDEFEKGGASGLTVGGGASGFTLEYLEIARVDFAGMLIKTDDRPQASMNGVRIRENYIHDTGAEGLYIGNTNPNPDTQHPILGLVIENNRVLRTGAEAIQLGQLFGDNLVHHNVFGPAAIDWRAVFGDFQDGNLQVRLRGGRLTISENVFFGAAGSLALFFVKGARGDDLGGENRVTVARNYFGYTRDLGLYVDSGVVDGLTYDFEDNVWDHYDFTRDEVYPDATPYDHLLRFATKPEVDVELKGTRWRGPDRLTNKLSGDGDGELAGFVGSGNRRTDPGALVFVESGLEPGFNWLRLERWTERATRGDKAPVSYERGDVVMHEAKAWRCKLATCAIGTVPPEYPKVWEPLGALADDVRIEPGSAHEGIGIVPEP